MRSLHQLFIERVSELNDALPLPDTAQPPFLCLFACRCTGTRAGSRTIPRLASKKAGKATGNGNDRAAFGA